MQQDLYMSVAPRPGAPLPYLESTRIAVIRICYKTRLTPPGAVTVEEARAGFENQPRS